MSVLVFVENHAGQFKKAGFEAASYASQLAVNLQTTATAVVLGTASEAVVQALGNYGISKVVCVQDAVLDTFEAHAAAKAVADVAKSIGASVVVLSNTYSGKALAPRLAVKLNAALAAGAVELPVVKQNELIVKRTVFSNKGFADLALKTAVKVISVTPNSYKVVENQVPVVIENRSGLVGSADFKARIVEVKKVTGKIPLTEAELVVSAGRGMKGPENWHMVESLASTLGAATACSKPVSDMHWRPHDEHVGQTGITIKPNLYIAIGISGAIQHLAGVSGSKVIVAINTDKEAPFFKIADYGIIGDAFEVLPKLNEAFAKFKAAN